MDGHFFAINGNGVIKNIPYFLKINCKVLYENLVKFMECFFFINFTNVSCNE